MKRDEKSRLGWVDLIESLAIFMVIFYHSTAFVSNYDLSIVADHQLTFYIFYFLRSIFTVCVPLFFFVNGFLLFRQNFDLKRHLTKIFKFTVLAIVWYALALGFLVLLHYDELPDKNIITLLGSVKSGVNHLWYLGALVCIYLLFPLLKVAYDRQKTIFLYFCLICFILTFGNSLLAEIFTLFSHTILKQGIDFSTTNFFSIFNPLRGTYAFSVTFFCLGGVANYYLPRLTSLPKTLRNRTALATLIFSWISLFLLSLLFSSVTGKIWDNVWFGYDTIFTLTAVLSIFILALNWGRESPLFTLISKNTLGIYLIHTLIIATLMTIFNPFYMQYFNPLNSNLTAPLLLLNLFLEATLILAISLVVTLFLHRIPFLRRLIC